MALIAEDFTLGMYTSIMHPELGIEIQIKTGFDDCEFIELGKEVPWKIWPDKPGQGHLLDGVYYGVSYPEEPNNWWVIIKDHKVVGLHEQFAPSKAWEMFYGIEAPPREWWTEEAWEAREKDIEARASALAERQLRQGQQGITMPELYKFMMEQMTEPSLMEQVLPITEIDDE